LAVLSPYYNSAFHTYSITYVYFHKLYYVLLLFFLNLVWVERTDIG